MPDGVTRQEHIDVHGFADTPGHGVVTVVSYDRPARWRRALKALGTWWGLAILAVFIPVAHLILVPSFFLFGLYQLYQRLNAPEVARDAHGTCPDCGAEQALDLDTRWHVPQQISCRECHRGLEVTAA